MSGNKQPRKAGGHSGAGAKAQSHNQQRKTHGQQQKPKIFEPYLPLEIVQEGIKKGHLIVGPIRINPKNYEDAYVPLPDGTADIYIGGMNDRNRALNTDEVVVQINPYDQWRVFVEDFEDFERASSSADLKSLNEEGIGAANDDADDDNDSGPDAVYDDDSDDNDIKTTKDIPEAAVVGVSEVGAALSRLELSSASPVQDVPKTASPGHGVQKMASSVTPSKSPNRSSKQGTPKVASTSSNRGSSRGTPIKKFTSITDMKTNGSPLAKDLFGCKLAGTNSAGDVTGFKFVQRTGKVVYIYEKKHSRAASGRLKLMQDKSKNFALFSPSDSRIPRIIIPMADCPKDFYERPEDFSQTLFIARIQQWDETSRMPKGCLARSLGEAGQIEPETVAMLIELDVDDAPFSDQIAACLPQNLPWSIPESEFSYRKDLRRSCIFTIDPATARDLDDAVSIEELENGLYEVGVHIADVSFFVKEGTELDAVAAKRATSVYLVQKVVPMLPRLLCEELCSLNPDHDRLAFSVIWTINGEGEIFEEWYGRTVIRSCVKLSYDHAQGFIDHPDKEWTVDELPPITNSFGVKDVMKRVLQLNKIALNLRKQRFDNGALRLDQVKLQFNLNFETGLPNGYSVYQQRDSNRLIEEFMLLANMAVAHKIKTSFPHKAILRRHPSPQVKPLQDVEELCESLGMKINATTAGHLQKSLLKYHGLDDYSQARIQVLVVLISKPMQNAKYFCAGTYPDESLYHHYALNVPLYTHFTSPIRRYPDILVHRLLAAALGYCEPPSLSTQLLQRQADYCNDKKNNAKMASERSSDMYFSIFVKEAGPLEETGMVMAVLDKAFDVLILKLGVIKRVYLERLPIKSFSYRKNMKCPELEIEWEVDEDRAHSTRHLITLFTLVDCCVFADKEPLKWSCVIKRPKDELKHITLENHD